MCREEMSERPGACRYDGSMDYVLFFFVAPVLVGVLFFPVVIFVIRRVRGGSGPSDPSHWRDSRPPDTPGL